MVLGSNEVSLEILGSGGINPLSIGGKLKQGLEAQLPAQRKKTHMLLSETNYEGSVGAS